MKDPTNNTPLERARAFAAAELGEGSVGVLDDTKTVARFLARVEHGFKVQDAVLAEVHRASKEDRQVANEFVSYFLQDMLRVGSGALRDGLRRYLDTGDLVMSVFGDLWSELADLKFESRTRFVTLLGRRLQWKAVDQARRGANRVQGSEALGASQLSSDQPGPETRFELDEEAERLALVLHRLSERDRRLLRMRLKGHSNEQIAQAEDMLVPATRKALERALERAQALVRTRS